MTIHDYNLANQAGAAFRSDLNNVLGAIVGLNNNATAPTTTFAYMLWADTTAGLLKQRNAANTGWIVRGSLAESAVVLRGTNTILAAADHGQAFIATGTFTQTFAAAATLGSRWFAHYRVQSGVTITFDPDTTEQIDGATTKVVVGPSSGLIFCSGTAFFTVGFDDPTATASVLGIIRLASQAEVNAGTEPTRAVTSATLQNKPSVAIGVGQTWQDLTASRALNTIYQNTTGRPIMVGVKTGGGDGGSANLEVGSASPPTIVVGGQSQTGAVHSGQLTAVIPDQWFYRVSAGGSMTLNNWAELR